MAVIYVRKTGNDTTGDGTYPNPYLTIARATLAWAIDDIIDVGEGNFQETAILSLINDRNAIRGQGWNKTNVFLRQATLLWAHVTSATLTKLLISDLSIVQAIPDLVPIKITNIATSARVTLARVLVRMDNSHLVQYLSNLTTPRVDLLHCVITSSTGSYGCLGLYSKVKDAIAVRNSVFYKMRLIVDDALNGRQCDLNFNLYYDNYRELRIGDYGPQDIRDKNPQFVDPSILNFKLIVTSPCRDAGVDLRSGYGTPNRPPPEELNWGFADNYPDIGLEEIVSPTASVPLRTFTFHTILQAFASEFEDIQAIQNSAKEGRFLAESSLLQMQQRWGALLGIFRIAGTEEEVYRSFIADLIDQSFTVAPAGGSLKRVVELLYDIQPIRYDYHKIRTFPLDPTLRITAVHASPGDNTLTARLSAGEFQIERVWYRVQQTDTVLAPNSVSILYADGSLTADETAEVLVSTDTSYRRGFKVVSLTGDLSFRKDQIEVVGDGTLFTTELQRHDLIRPSGTVHYYVVDDIQDDLHLTLRRAFSDDDIFAPGELAQPIIVFGEVTTNGVTITAIKCPGSISQIILASFETKSHGYHLVVQATGSALDDTDDKAVLLQQIMCRFAPVHKLGYISFEDEFPAGRVLCEGVRLIDQSTVAYLEDAEDSTWPDS